MSKEISPLVGTQNKEKVTIIGRNLQVTPAIREHILLKIRKIEELTPNVIDVAVFLETQRSDCRVEILYKFSHFFVMTHAVLDDMYQAIDLAASRLKRKLMKWKTKIHNHSGKKLSEVEMDIHVLDRQKEDLLEVNDQIEDESFIEMDEVLNPAMVVKKKKKTIPLLTIEEAAMRMDLTDDHFMAYRSEEDMKLKVMYVRRDKTLGILEIE
jgi:putative sigma-54 modulation protein